VARKYHKRHDTRLMQLALVDEMLADGPPGPALAMMDAAYPIDRLHSDEDFRRPSEDFQVRATLLHAHFLRLKERQGSRWHSYYDDLLVILKAASVRGSEKQALAQQLVLDHPSSSQIEIARHSEDYGEMKFDLVDDREANLGAYLRRKNVAALLAICAEYRITNIPYVGATTVVSLSNGCIRDYLEL